ncbi:MAG: hypothetical protein Q7J67_06890 [bacterium]|nr:hypothetical protein [bacterium]
MKILNTIMLLLLILFETHPAFCKQKKQISIGLHERTNKDPSIVVSRMPRWHGATQVDKKAARILYDSSEYILEIRVDKKIGFIEIFVDSIFRDLVKANSSKAIAEMERWWRLASENLQTDAFSMRIKWIGYKKFKALVADVFYIKNSDKVKVRTYPH